MHEIAVSGEIKTIAAREGSSGIFTGDIEGLYQGYRFGSTTPDEREFVIEPPNGTIALLLRQQIVTPLPPRPAEASVRGRQRPFDDTGAFLAEAFGGGGGPPGGGPPGGLADRPAGHGGTPGRRPAARLAGPSRRRGARHGGRRGDLRARPLHGDQAPRDPGEVHGHLRRARPGRWSSSPPSTRWPGTWSSTHSTATCGMDFMEAGTRETLNADLGSTATRARVPGRTRRASSSSPSRSCRRSSGAGPYSGHHPHRERAAGCVAVPGSRRPWSA